MYARDSPREVPNPSSHTPPPGYFSSIDPDSNTQRTTATTPSPPLRPPHGIASLRPPVVLVCVYFCLSFFLNLCRPPFSTSSRPKEQSPGSRLTVPAYPSSTSRRRSSSRTTSEKPMTLTSSFTIPPIRVRPRIRATSDHYYLLPLLPLSRLRCLLFSDSRALCHRRV